jgi:hypothetical protein
MQILPSAVYLLCLAASAVCTFLLFRAWRASGSRLLFLSALCFVGLTLNNALLFIDVVLLPVEVDLRPFRLLSSIGAVGVLLYGFIWETE